MMEVIKEVMHGLLVAGGALALTLALFLVLPLIETISKPPTADAMVRGMDVVAPPPPPPPQEEPPPDEPEEEVPPPELDDAVAPLDLSQLELALNPGYGGDGLLPDVTNRLVNGASSGGDVDALFSLSDLDQKPRAMYQPSPTLDAKLRKNAPATVYVLFVVDQNGRVQDARVQSSSNPMFDMSALNAVKKWKFEPGKRNGVSVRFRMRVPISFPKER